MLTFLFDDHRAGHGLLFQNPASIITANDADDVSSCFQSLNEGVAQGYHAAGYLSFELSYALEPKLNALMPKQRAIPLLQFGLYEAPVELNALGVQEWLSSENNSFNATEAKPTLTKEDYQHRFNRIREYIRSGDVYQINLTFKANFKIEGNLKAYFAEYRKRQRVSFGAFLQSDCFSILSFSPELFFSQHGDFINTRPMKGTAPRGKSAREDIDLRCWLSHDEKSRAENLMIVDLMRNDFARIAKPGSVCVTDLYSVDAYESLLQMTSGITASVEKTLSPSKLITSLFPPGSVTGAPKIRALEIIKEIEQNARGIYTGALGFISPVRRAIFNVAIRTVTVDANGHAEIGIGSGIVNDSVAEAEYNECLLKLNFLKATAPQTYALLETMLWNEHEGYVLLDRHLERLSLSAQHLSFVCNTDKIVSQLQANTRGLEGSHRVRLILKREGDVTLHNTKLIKAEQQKSLRFVVSDETVHSSDWRLYHKTTARDFYDRARERANRTKACDEVVFVNERGLLTEGSFTTLFVEIDGVLLTPPLSAGLLPGTLRAEMLAKGEAIEAELYPEDLKRATSLWLGNSVRGLLRAECVDGMS